MKNKRGLELVWNSFVVMILAIVVLLVLIGFFMMSSSNFMEKIKGYFSYSNVDEVVSGCNSFSQTNALYSFCCEKKEVKYYLDGEKKSGEFSCYELSLESFSDNRIINVGCAEVSCLR